MNALVATEPKVDGEAQYLTFVLGGEMFAMDILGIKEIIEYGNLTTVPMMPAFVRGVINLRGAVVPVVDLAVRFGRPSTPVNKRSCIVILEVHGEEGVQDIGVLVDAVSAVLSIAAADIEPAPSFGGGIRADFIGGMAKVDGRFVIVLSVERVLSVEEMAQLSQAGDGRAPVREGEFVQ
ncbi:chemotaxis protein CheW [Zobellella sp. An-6]|uniref:chemotaxis protein CheW n=1 Tax=Zobellella sp. An-6 TaxID=3400218 RepID=UPI0040437893